MTKVIIYIAVILSFLQFTSCEKDPKNNPSPTPIENNYAAELSIVWEQWIYDDSTGAFLYSPRFAGDYVAIFAYMPNRDNNKLGMVIYDRATGEPHPAWDHEPNFDINSVSDWDIGGKNSDVIAFLSGRNIYAYDINTGQELWNKYSGSDEYYNYRLSSYGNYLFVSKAPATIESAWESLLRINLHTGEEKTILKIDSVNAYSVGINPPSVDIMDNGDTLLIFQNRQHNFGTADGKIDIYAYNMTADSILWIRDDLTASGNSSVREGNITGNKYLFQGSKSIHCLDLANGNILWEDEYQMTSFFQTHNLYADGKVFMNSESGAIICYDVASGNKLWHNTKEDATPSGSDATMGVYDGKLYISAIPTHNQGIPISHSYAFKCISVATGEVLWSTKQGSSGVIIDQQTGYLYVGSSAILTCVDLNKTPVE